MTVATLTNKTIATGNGVATTFPFTFGTLPSGDIEVSVFDLDGLAITTPTYTVLGEGAEDGGAVVFSVAPTDGYTILIQRILPVQQPDDLKNQGSFYPRTIERMIDRGVMISQQLGERIGSALTLPAQVTGVSTTLPSPLGGAPLIWSADGTGIENGDEVMSGDLLLRGNLADGATAGRGAALVGFRRQNGTAAVLSDMVREKLASDITYYVRTDGSDSNTGLANTAGGAFLTLQYAVDFVRSALDFNGRNVIIQMGAGTYSVGCALFGPHVGKGDLYVFGDQVTPGNVLISTTAAAGHCFALYDGASIIIRGVKLAASGVGSCCLLAYTGSHINAGAIEYGACNYMHNEAGSEAVIELYAPYTISGSATGHWHTGSPSQINIAQFTATLTGTPAFSAYFAGTAGGFIKCSGFQWTGSATGPRYLAHKGGIIDGNTGLNPFLPGSTAGRVATGGIAKAGVTTAVDYSADTGVNDSIRFGAVNTGTGAFTPFITMSSAATPVCSIIANGVNAYENTSTFGNTAAVLASAGAGNTASHGWTFRNFNGGYLVDAQVGGGPIGYFQRRLNDGAVFVFVDNTGDQVGSISINSAGNSTAYNTTSDERLKDFIPKDEAPPYDPEWLSKVAALVQNFRFKGKGKDAMQIGVPAQRLYKVDPGAVTVGEGEPGKEGFMPWGVDPSKLIWRLILAVEALENRVTALED